MTGPYVPSSHKGALALFAFYLACALVLAALITGAVWAWRAATAETAGRVEARQQIQSAGNRIQAYEHFYNLCAAVQGLDAGLAAQYEERASATGSDLARVNANIAGLRAQRGRSIAQYNVDARKSYTGGQFRASDLPYQLPVTYTKGATVSCEA